MKLDPHALYSSARPVGRPKTRWDDALTNFFYHSFPDNRESHWTNVLASSNCVDLEKAFVAYVCNFVEHA